VVTAEESFFAGRLSDNAASRARASVENELLQEVVGFLSAHAVGVANHRGDGVDDRFRDGASDFDWKPPEVTVDPEISVRHHASAKLEP
jgi:hypothetical protein